MVDLARDGSDRALHIRCAQLMWRAAYCWQAAGPAKQAVATMESVLSARVQTNPLDLSSP